MTATRLFSATTAAVFALTLAACSDTTATSNSDVLGHWGLSTINGAGLPFTMDTLPDARLEIFEDNIVLQGDGTLAGGTTWRVVDHDGVRETLKIAARGRWVRTGDAVRITFEEIGSANTTTAALGERSLTLEGNGYVFVYRR